MADKPVIKQWVAALRSGRFKQGRNLLRNVDKYCCLGVLQQLYCDHKKQDWCSLTQTSAWLSGGAAAWVGLNLNPSLVTKEGQRVSATMANDELKLSFKEIADLIENTYLKPVLNRRRAPEPTENVKRRRAPENTQSPQRSKKGSNNGK